MTKIRPYLAVDIETTGLDTERVHILQIGWVIDDGVSPLADLKRGSVIVKEPFISYGEPFALQMNAWLFREMDSKTPKYPVVGLAAALTEFFIAVAATSGLAEKFDRDQGETKPSQKIQLAGKNVSAFDRRIIMNCEKKLELDFWAKNLLDHRDLDCGSIYFSDFGRNPGFDKINKLIGWKDINHDALDDAANVVVAIRRKAGLLI